MSVGYYGYHSQGDWHCTFNDALDCDYSCDSDSYGDIEAHEWFHEGFDPDGKPMPPTPELELQAALPLPKSRGTMKIMNYLRVNDDLVEYTSAFIQDDGNVVISAAWFKTLMGEAGWKIK